MRFEPRILVLSLAVIVVLGAFWFLQGRGVVPTSATNEQLTVIDGDTYRLGSRKLRLIDIDTPEPTKYGNAECASEAALGDKATIRARQLVEGREVVVVWSERKGRYGRDLVDILLDGEFLSDILVEEGLAKRWTGQPYDWCE